MCISHALQRASWLACALYLQTNQNVSRAGFESVASIAQLVERRPMSGFPPVKWSYVQVAGSNPARDTFFSLKNFKQLFYISSTETSNPI